MSAEGKALGIDIGGTKIAVASVLATNDASRPGRPVSDAERSSGWPDASLEIVALDTLPTESERGFDSGVARIREVAGRVLDESGWSARELAGIGVGCAGPVDPRRGTIDNPYTLPGWVGGNIVAALGKTFPCPVVLENDADAARLGECWAGAGRGFDPVVMLTFGTGIGGAALVSGSLVRGVAGAHPEMGHLVVDRTGPPCYCGTSGCFESLASGTALNAAAAAHGLGEARQLLDRAASSDPVAVELRERALEATGRAAWTLLHALLPERIVLGGGMMDEHYEPFAQAVRASIAAAKAIPPGRVSVARAQLGNRAGLVGAASTVFSRASQKATAGRPVAL